MEVKFAHLCDYASVSREGKLSVMGIFSNIGVQTLPALHPIAYLAFEMELRSAEMDRESEIEIDVVDADGNNIWKMEGKFKGDRRGKPGERATVGQIIPLQGLTFQRYGAHEINIFLNGQPKATVSFNVTVAGPPPQQGS